MREAALGRVSDISAIRLLLEPRASALERHFRHAPGRSLNFAMVILRSDIVNESSFWLFQVKPVMRLVKARGLPVRASCRLFVDAERDLTIFAESQRLFVVADEATHGLPDASVS